MAACRSCGAAITWATTGANDRPIPLDAEPNPAGNVELIERQPGWTPYAKTWGTSHVWPEGTVRFMPHHATCPEGKEWRRTRGRG